MSESSPECEARYDLACRLAVSAGQTAFGSFRGSFDVDWKAKTQVVTSVDRQVEQDVRNAIVAAFPADGIVGEELEPVVGDSGFVWALDPIDGTQNFWAGIPVFSAAVSVLHRGRPVAAAIYDPVADELYAARAGGGAWCGRKRLSVAPGSLTARSVVTCRHRFFRGRRQQLLEALPTAKLRCLGSVCLEMAYVAAGHVSLALAAGIHLWEAAPAQLLIEEAGGVVRDHAGRAVFPLASPASGWGSSVVGILAGSTAAVESVASLLRGAAD